MASTYLTRTMGTATSRFTFTLSMWVKRSSLGSQVFWGSRNTDNYRFQVYFDGSDKLNVLNIDNSSTNLHLKTNRLFKDTNGWFHIYVAVKSSESTSSDRCKIYVNGVRETSLETATYQSTSNDMSLGASTYTLNIGRYGSGSDYFDGLMSHCYYVDGSVIAHTQFGSQDTTTGEWKINTAPTISSYGNQGFLILKDGNTVTDQSPNSNNFTVGGGEVTKTEDNPSNVYATANPLVRNQVTITTANLTVRSPSSNWMGIPATMGVSSGKYYWEYKLALGNAWSQCGVMSSISNGGYNGIYSTYVGNLEGGLALNSGNGDFYHDGSSGAYSTSAWFSGGLAEYDIIGVALDATNSKIWFSKNGTWGNSSNPSTGSGGIDFSGDTDFTNHKPYFPAFSMHNCILTLNFGNGYLGTSEITTNSGSGFQDADGNGRFYYAVPTNFRCLSTKGLNQ